MTSASIDPTIRELIFELLRQGCQRPTDILANLISKQLAPSQIQDNLALLLDAGEITMGVDRRLYLVKAAAV